MLAVVVAAEIPIRALLMADAVFLPYMALTNWATVFFLGIYGGQLPDEGREKSGGLLPWAVALVLWLVIWSWSLGALPTFAKPGLTGPSFPFIRLKVGSPAASLLVTSTAITLSYGLTTWLIYQTTRRLRDTAFVRFFAANTLIIFLAHMPINNEMFRLLVDRLGNGWLLLALRVAVCFFLLGLVSECIRRMTRPVALREWTWVRLQGLLSRPPTHAVAPLATSGR
jgi:hypothetical protein